MALNKSIFCNRKDGATIKGKFYPLPRTSALLAEEIERQSDKAHARRMRRLGRS